MGSDGEVMGSDRCKKKFEMCGGGSFLELGATELSRGLGIEPWLGVEPWPRVEPRLGGLAWLSCGSHSIERKAGKRLKLN
ncbi:hypothetical protein CDL15_Pgr020639 [Punica granatum]|uniref:Uncharacterized protein n=1 Tax=Punica granatum TaxID=22663 RepID=A0A218VRX2_PUNGR|nr:hypothetical protein CDL15_Pgr020639 [Punica granatum]PKI31842.1 hypothetical protein CRG98_047767 [Punica granatum]